MKMIDLKLASELSDQKPSGSNEDKKSANAAKKKLKEAREKYPVRIEIKFKTPWWSPET